MSIQWFPGHMHLTQKALRERVKSIDVVIELLDARLPGSSANPLLARITAARPALKLLNKQDLADPTRTQAWLAHYNARPGTRALAAQANEAALAPRLLTACRELAPGRGGLARPMRVLVCGIPNVGKSTLINRLIGKRQAKVADEPGVTRQEQRLLLADDFYLYDTPGVLWPRIIAPESGYRLAASGAVGRNAYDDEEVALELLTCLRRAYPNELAARYRLTPEDAAALPEDQLLQAIARRRGALRPGARADTRKAAEALLADLRTAALGRVTLETPEEFTQWLRAGQAAEAQKKAEREARREEKGTTPPARRS